MTEWGWVCDPYKLNIKIALTLGIGNFKRQRKCTLTGIVKNFNNFFNGTFSDGGWQSWFEISNLIPTPIPECVVLEHSG